VSLTCTATILFTINFAQWQMCTTCPAKCGSKEVRSYNMSQVRSKNTKPELLVRKFLHAHSFRYRLHVKDLPGKPDLVLPKYKTVIFIHGCFWHGHKDCKYFVVPKTRTEWWLAKIKKKDRNYCLL
jgi:DNA mismatch endonuclease (patch repair protein)